MANSEASDLVEEAINKALPMIPGFEDADLLIDWIVIAYVDNSDPEGDSGYPMIFSNGDMPGYKARGLLATGTVKLEEILEDRGELDI